MANQPLSDVPSDTEGDMMAETTQQPQASGTPAAAPKRSKRASRAKRRAPGGRRSRKASPKRRSAARKATTAAAPKRPRRRRSRARAAAAPKPRRAVRRRRFTETARQQILATAQREGLSGAQVAERFGISAVTYYLWRKRSGAPLARRGRPRAASVAGLDVAGELRRQVREQLQRLVPGIVRSEVDAMLSGLGSGRRGRRRRG
jgi:transposase-like protein